MYGKTAKRFWKRYMAIFMSIVLIAGLSEGPGAVEVKAEVGKRNAAGNRIVTQQE